MATFTEHYSLIKPDAADYYDVADFNENMDSMDTALAETAAEVEGVSTQLGALSDKIGSAGDSGSDTLFGLMNAGGGAVKSIQRVTYYNKNDGNGAAKAIRPVNPEKCFVLMEFLYCSPATQPYIDYTLAADKLTITHGGNSYNTYHIMFGFWIVEFY